MTIARFLGPIALVLACFPLSVAAQVFGEIHVGALGSSILVRDSINQEITVGPEPAPTVALTAGSRLSDTWLVSAGLRWSRSDLSRHEADQTITVMPLTVWTGSVALRRSLNTWASVAGTVGGIKYDPGAPDVEGTLFQEGSPLFPMAGVSARVEYGLGTRWRVGLDVAYDFHRFTTPALREGGIGEHRSVHRIAVSAVLRGSTVRDPH